MVDYLDPELQQRIAQEDDTVLSLLVGVSENRMTVMTEIEQTDASVEHAVGRTTIKVTSPVSTIEQIQGFAGVEWIEINREDVQEA